MPDPSSGGRVATDRAADPAPAREGGEAAAIRPRYLWTMLGSVAACFGLYYALLVGLSATGNLPPPGFSNSICIDEKLSNLREHPVGQPNLLVVGSSVAWRHFDGEAVQRVAPASVPFNGGFCGLALNQSVYTANWLLSHHPSVREVLLIASPQDFENCTTPRTAVFDAADADDYAFRRGQPWGYYLKYFSPAALLRNAATIAGRRNGENKMDPLVFDRYGAGPLDTEESRDTLLYGQIKRLDPACFAALRGLAERLRQEGRRLMVSSTPMHPDWKTLYDADGQTRQTFNSGVRAALGGRGEYWDSDAADVVSEEAFYDGIHLRWSAVTPFSEALARHFRFNSEPAAPSSVRAAKL
jgi:hypothetical protein